MTEQTATNGSEKAMESAQKIYTREDIEGCVAEVEKKISENSTVTMHSMLVLNHVFRQSNAAQLLDDDLNSRIRDLWTKIKKIGASAQRPAFNLRNSKD